MDTTERPSDRPTEQPPEQPTRRPAVEPTTREALERMDRGWSEFRRRVHDLPAEHLGSRLGEGAWTRKQMLGHIATWHEMTADRLGRFAASGEPNAPDDHEDVINARAAHAAEGRTTGEILLNLDESFRRLRREVSRLTDAQLVAHDYFAVSIIAGNSFGHYEEHLADLDLGATRR